MEHKNYIPLVQWEKKHGYPTTAGLRWLVFNGKKNGFDRCIRRIGRRVLICEEDYFEWLENQKMAA